MKTNLKFLSWVGLAMVLMMVGASCNTFRGFGRDVRHAGGHIERAAN